MKMTIGNANVSKFCGQPMMKKIFVIPLLVSMLLGCEAEDLCSTSEINALASPSGKTKALIIQRDCGATTSAAYAVHVVATNEEPSERNIVFRSDMTEDISLSWRNNTTLIITYEKARIFNFTNFWQPSSGNPAETIRVLEFSKNELLN